MSDIKNMVAFDCSNSSIRTILGTYDGSKLQMETVLQRHNDMVHVNDVYYWDIIGIYKAMTEGLAEAVRRVEKIDSIGVCTWGVDFALYTSERFMLSNPLAYRNPFGAEILDRYSEAEQSRLFEETGILCDKINSIYMLKAIQERFPSVIGASRKLLMIPDILNYMLTGVMQNEPSELSTSQLMDVAAGEISESVCDYVGIDKDIFCKTGVHGAVIGRLLPHIAAQLDIDYDIPVICVPSHDTAAAVLAVPAEGEDFAFISSGTWALIGSEEDAPVINGQVREAKLTNELGAFGKITLLRNNMGMFIVQRLKTELEEDISWEEFYRLSDVYSEDLTGNTARRKKEVPHFDVNDQRFFNPDSMSDAIWTYFTDSGQVPKGSSKDFGLIIRSFLESLALSYRENLEELEKIRGKEFSEIYIVGGGAKNHRLNRLTAQYTGKTVVTGSSESTSYGNLLAQVKYFEPDRTVEGLREIMRNSIELEKFKSEGGTDR